VKKGNSIYPEAGGTFMKAKISPEEKHHLYISEAELQMHQARTPLWAKPEVYICSVGMKYVFYANYDAFSLIFEMSLVLVHLLADLLSVDDGGSHKNG
jgi:hypothetical protein